MSNKLNLAVKREVLLRDDEWRRFEELSRDAGLSCNGQKAGILMATPYSFGVCYKQSLDRKRLCTFLS